MDDEAEHQVDRKVLDVLFVVEALYVASSTRLASIIGRKVRNRITGWRETKWHSA